MSPWLRVRVLFDRVLAAVLLVGIAPVLAVVALLVRREDGGPALISVARSGQGGYPFRMWKVRTMRVTEPDGRAGGAALTQAADPRITRIGAHLRSWHLDEVPQLYNVVRGEMALLGPRPEDPRFVDRDAPRWQAVLVVPPGIAGPTQLAVGDWEREVITADPSSQAYVERVLPVKLAIDGWYARRASPRTDLLVLTGLVRQVAGSEPGALLAAVRRAVPEFAEVPGTA